MGTRLTEKWNRWLECAVAALYERYIVEHPQAHDVEDALQNLMALYDKEGLFRWRLVPPNTAKRLDALSKTALARSSGGSLQADALFLKALATYSKKLFKRHAFGKVSVKDIRFLLKKVISEHPESPRCFDASMGLISLALLNDQRLEAKSAYRKLVERYADDRKKQDKIQEELGSAVIYLRGLPDFGAQTIDGSEISRQDLRGKVFLLDFWATWCLPCVDEFKTIRKLHEKYDGEKFEIIGINLDRAEDMPLESLRKWLDREKIPWKQIYDGQGWDSKLVKAFSVEEIPYTVVVDSEGTVLGANLHGRSLSEIVNVALKKREK